MANLEVMPNWGTEKQMRILPLPLRSIEGQGQDDAVEGGGD